MTAATGTVAFTMGSDMIKGTGTIFTQELTPNSFVYAAQDISLYRVIEVIDDATIIVTPPVKGRAGNTVSGLTLLISPAAADFSPILSLPLPTPHLQDSSSILNRAWKIVDRELPTKI